MFNQCLSPSIFFFNTHNGSDDLGGLAGTLGFAEYLCLDLMAPSEIHCQDHKKSDTFPLQILWGVILYPTVCEL